MLRRTMLMTLAFALALGIGTASAQEPCLLGVYADEAGAMGGDMNVVRDLGNPIVVFDVYYVLFVEDFVNAVAWNREITGFPGSGVFSTSVDVVDSGYGTFVDIQPEGFRMGIGTCKIGFGGVPITVMRETLTWLSDFNDGGGTIAVTANSLEGPTPVYNTCTNDILPCQGGQILVNGVIANDSQSWGQVKALYNSN